MIAKPGPCFLRCLILFFVIVIFSDVLESTCFARPQEEDVTQIILPVTAAAIALARYDNEGFFAVLQGFCILYYGYLCIKVHCRPRQARWKPAYFSVRPYRFSFFCSCIPPEAVWLDVRPPGLFCRYIYRIRKSRERRTSDRRCPRGSACGYRRTVDIYNPLLYQY